MGPLSGRSARSQRAASRGFTLVELLVALVVAAVIVGMITVSGSPSPERALRFDGRVWDAKTLQSLSSKVTPRTTRYARIEIDDLARRHPGLVGWQELHPRLRSGLLTAAVAVVLALIAAVNLWPEAFAL